MTSALSSTDRARALEAMICYGGFQDTPALDRWSATDEALPHLREWLQFRLRPGDREFFAIDFALEAAKDQAARQLADDIQLRFG